MLIRQQNATSNWKAISIINKKIFSSRISLFLFYVKNGYRANNKKKWKPALADFRKQLINSFLFFYNKARLIRTPTRLSKSVRFSEVSGLIRFKDLSYL